jgi:hypothetical protein
MDRIWRRVCTAVNPVSTAATSWWCHSAVRHLLTGDGLTAQQRQFIRDRRRPAAFALSTEQVKARGEAIDGLLRRDDHECEPGSYQSLMTRTSGMAS